MISEVAALLGALRTSSDLIKVMVDTRDQAAFQARLIELQQAILSAQTAALGLQTENAALLSENRDLKDQAMRAEQWKTEAERYRLNEISPGVLVYSLKDAVEGAEPMHHLCPTCYQQGVKSILQSNGSPGEYGGTEVYMCRPCGLQVGVRRVGKPLPRRGKASDWY